jgi:hypothetical protein
MTHGGSLLSGLRVQGSGLREHPAPGSLRHYLIFNSPGNNVQDRSALNAVPCTLEVLGFVLQREVVVQIVFLVVE